MQEKGVVQILSFKEVQSLRDIYFKHIFH